MHPSCNYHPLSHLYKSRNNLKVHKHIPSIIVPYSNGASVQTYWNFLFKSLGRKAIVSSAFPHFGEESVLQGWNGSGTIFFGMCNLRCVFCQNWDISQKKNGWELDGKEIADLMLKLQNETKYFLDIMIL